MGVAGRPESSLSCCLPKAEGAVKGGYPGIVKMRKKVWLKVYGLKSSQSFTQVPDNPKGPPLVLFYDINF